LPGLRGEEEEGPGKRKKGVSPNTNRHPVREKQKEGKLSFSSTSQRGKRGKKVQKERGGEKFRGCFHILSTKRAARKEKGEKELWGKRTSRVDFTPSAASTRHGPAKRKKTKGRRKNRVISRIALYSIFHKSPEQERKGEKKKKEILEKKGKGLRFLWIAC